MNPEVLPSSMPSPAPRQNNNKILVFVIIFFLIIGYISTFFAGLYLSKILLQETQSSQKPVIKSTPTQFPTKSMVTVPDILPQDQNRNTPQETTRFLPGKHYFDDTVILVTKDKPYRVLVATVTRKEQERNYQQDTRVSYFDGNNWTRKQAYKTINDSTIISNELIKQWNINIDPSRILKQDVSGQINISGSTISFSTGLLNNEISIRSLPGYTKFLSKGEGTLTINNNNLSAFVLYTKIYSLNAAEIQFYDQPFGLLTDWVIFWDNEGNMYHIDATSVDKPTEIYKTHQIGVAENANGSVSKTFKIDIQRDAETPPRHYLMHFNNPMDIKLDFNRVNSINKAPNNSFKWYMGLIEGNAIREDGKTISGVGLVEYIQN